MNGMRFPGLVALGIGALLGSVAASRDAQRGPETVAAPPEAASVVARPSGCESNSASLARCCSGALNKGILLAQATPARTFKPGVDPAGPGGLRYYTDQFNGIIGRTAAESQPAWPKPLRAKPGSPNIVWIVLDDVGFSQLACFGGLCSTPNIDRLAKNGLRYNNFHTTALCSPTRAALLTGRNHHTNALGVIAEFSTGYPGYNGAIPFENGFLSEILAQNGFATYAVGKWHLTPDEEMNMAARKDRWPLGRGFERFYGFLGGDTHQYYPDLVHDNHEVEPPKTPEQGYHFTEDMTDKAIQYVRDLRNVVPDKPFFLYYAPGAMHAPHHVRKEWIARQKGKFDIGWDEAREVILKRQKQLGLVPPNTVLPPRNAEVAAWDSLSDRQKALYAYMMEVFAGVLEHTDHEIGRLLAYLEQSGRIEHTLIVVTSDNGASSVGRPNGLLNEGSFFNKVEEDVDYLWQNRDRLGGPDSFNHYPFGWTMAGNTPFKKWKREVHLGGIRDPLIIHWPKGIKARGELRTQYAHPIDLLATMLDVLGVEAPRSIKGYPQNPIHGISFAHSFNDAKAPSRRPTQYYEMLGYRAIYHDGWTAVSPHLPFDKPLDEAALVSNRWELYHTDEDFSQAHDLADSHPEKVEEMEQRWWAEAGRYDVMPLDSGRPARLLTSKPELTGPRTRYEYYPDGAPVGKAGAAPTINRSYTITAEVVIPEKGAQGVLLAHGGQFGGYAFYIRDDRLRFTYNWLGRDWYDVGSDEAVPAGKVTLGYEFRKTGAEPIGADGVGRLFVNGKPVGEAPIAKTVAIIYWPHGEGLTCGYDHLTPVAKAYQSPFRFTGTIRRVVVDVAP
jgi:arylsulfatase